MEKIGEKIKRIRKENGWSQEAVLPNQQSLVSQIEKGTITNPGRVTLEKIAKNLDRPYNELIEGTDWNPVKEASPTNEYAFSRTEANVSLDETGEIIIHMKSYLRYNDKGEENIYSPENGLKLVTKCGDWINAWPDENLKGSSKTDSVRFDFIADGKIKMSELGPCGRSIDSPTQHYCMSCGQQLTQAANSSWPRLNNAFWSSIDTNRKEIDRVSLLIKDEEERWSEALSTEPSAPHIELGKLLIGDFDFGIDRKEFNQGHSSPNQFVRMLWEMHDLKLSVLKGLLLELKKWTVKIIGREVAPHIEPTLDNENDEDNKTEVS